MLDRETAPQRHFAVRITFREEETYAQSARDFMSNYQAAERRRYHSVDWFVFRPLGECLGEFPAENFGEVWILEYQGRLQIPGAV